MQLPSKYAGQVLRVCLRVTCVNYVNIYPTKKKRIQYSLQKYNQSTYAKVHDKWPLVLNASPDVTTP